MTTVLGAVRPGPFVSLAVAAYFAQAVLPVGLQAGAATRR